jgi:hypothetical protein
MNNFLLFISHIYQKNTFKNKEICEVNKFLIEMWFFAFWKGVKRICFSCCLRHIFWTSDIPMTTLGGNSAVTTLGGPQTLERRGGGSSLGGLSSTTTGRTLKLQKKTVNIFYSFYIMSKFISIFLRNFWDSTSFVCFLDENFLIFVYCSNK